MSLDNLDLNVIQFIAPIQWISNYIYLPIQLATAILTLLLMISILADLGTSLDGFILVLSLVGANTIHVVAVVYFNIESALHNGYSHGKLGCIFQYILYYALSIINIWNTVLISLDRYLAVRYQSGISRRVGIILAISSWVFGFALPLLAFLLDSPENFITIESSNTYCSIAWNGTSDGSIYGSVIAAGGIISFTTANLILNGLLYRTITMPSRIFNDQMKQLPNHFTSENSGLPAYSESKYNSNSVGARNALAFSAGFFFCWMPYGVQIAYMAITNRNANIELDVITSGLIGLSSVLTLFVLIKYDHRVRKKLMCLYQLFR